jgi:hypothetical protein
MDPLTPLQQGTNQSPVAKQSGIVRSRASTDYKKHFNGTGAGHKYDEVLAASALIIQFDCACVNRQLSDPTVYVDRFGSVWF